MTYQLQYVNGSICETYYFYNMALCYYKRNQLVAQGSHNKNKFKIITIKN